MRSRTTIIRTVYFTLILFILVLLPANSIRNAFGNTDETICGVYISGIGCGNCAVTDPLLFLQLTSKYPKLVVIEYEIYRQRKENRSVKKDYFLAYLPFRRPGIPFLTFGPDKTVVGKTRILKIEDVIQTMSSNPCPLPLGSSENLKELDIAGLRGKVKLWTKNRVLISGKGGDNRVLRRLLIEENLTLALKGVNFKKVKPEPVTISRGQIHFQYAVKIGNWRLQWNGDPVKVTSTSFQLSEKTINWILGILVLCVALFLLFKIQKTEKGITVRLQVDKKLKERIIVVFAMIALVFFLIFVKGVSPDLLEQMGYKMPLALFTFFIALVDGFNPCNMFVLTCLLALLISTSDSRKRLFTVSFSFVFVVFIFYFLFMALWLNVFNYISFINPLRIAIAIIAIVAGLINCKEILFFKKGISLTIQEEHKGFLMEKMRGMKEIIRSGSYPLLISSSIALAVFASLIELPCTAGFPIIYTGILSGKVLQSTFWYYAYLVYYNVIYVVPLLAIITIFIFTFRAKTISVRQVQIIKFIGGIIMILLGIILLINPSLIGLGIG